MELQQQENKNMEVVPVLDDFKKKVCHSQQRDTSFQEFWTGTLGLPLLDLNKVTAEEMEGIGNLLSAMPACDEWYPTNPIGRGTYFKVVIRNSKKHPDFIIGLTSDFMFFDSDYEKAAKLEPIAGYELREMFGFGSIFGNWSKPVAPNRECDKFKKKECGYRESYRNKPFKQLWEDVWGLPPIDFNTLNFSQVSSISTFLGYDDYSVMKPGMKRGNKYFAIVDHNYAEYGKCDSGEYAQGLTSDYYFFEDNNFVDYPEAAKEMMELFPEAYQSRSTNDNEVVMRALGGLWGGKVEITESSLKEGTTKEGAARWGGDVEDGTTVYKIQGISSRASNAIKRISEYYDDETGMRRLHCLKRDNWPLRFYNVDERSYLYMGFNKEMVQWQSESDGKDAAEFIWAYDEGEGEKDLTEEQQEIVGGLRERGSEWLQIWAIEKGFDDHFRQKKTRVNYFQQVEKPVDFEKVAEYLREKKWIQNQPYYDSVLIGTMEGKKVLVVEKEKK